MGVIYKITSPSDKIYIGKTKNLRKRKTEHIRQAQKGTDGILYNSIRKYGWHHHKLEIIEEIQDDLLNEREVFWIAEYNTYWKDNSIGMNLTKGGDGNNGSWMHKTELREWFSDKFKGEGNPFYGKTHTEEFRKEQSQRAKKYSIEKQTRIPKWGVEKGRLKVMRSVLCYDKYGNFLKKYDSARDAEKELNINHESIAMVCNGKRTHVNELIFRYFEPGYLLKIEVKEFNKASIKRPVLYLDKRHSIIKEYPSSLEASLDLKIPKTTINRAANYNKYKPIRSGHIFIYKDLHENFKIKTA